MWRKRMGGVREGGGRVNGGTAGPPSLALLQVLHPPPPRSEFGNRQFSLEPGDPLLVWI